MVTSHCDSSMREDSLGYVARPYKTLSRKTKPQNQKQKQGLER